MANNIIKQKAFNERMGIKKPKHMYRGGKVKGYAAGGVTVNPATGVPLGKSADPTVNALGAQDPNTVLSGPSPSSVYQNASNPNTGIIGSIGGALGLNNNFQAGAANIQAGTNAGQLNNAYLANQTALQNQQNLANTFNPQAAQAVANQNAVAQQQLNMLNGTGPNPALAQLAQTTGQNVANQAALMAGQRGASANVGLMAREAAQQGAQTQQQGVGQAATLAAQQQIAAQQNLANLAAQQAQQATLGSQNLIAGQQGEQGILQGANTAFNNAGVGMQSNINTVNAGTAANNQNFFGKIIGGALTGASGVAGNIGKAISSMFAEGGEVHSRIAKGPSMSHVVNHLNMARGGEVPAKVSPGEVYLRPDQVKQVIHEGANPLKIGYKFTGKAKVKGDSKKNDNIPTELEEGGIVIKRSIVNKNDPDKARLFVHQSHMKRPK